MYIPLSPFQFGFILGTLFGMILITVIAIYIGNKKDGEKSDENK